MNIKQKNKLIILTAGGSGGHVYPAEALAEELSKKGYTLALVTDKRGQDNYKGQLGKIKNYSVLSGALVGKSKWIKFKHLFLTALGVLQSIMILLKNRPLCVVGFGGYAAFPCSIAAQILGVKLIIQEQNSVMSRTNRWVVKRANLVVTSFMQTSHIPATTKTIHTGTPVRKSILDLHNLPYPKNNTQLKILIFGGSQGAQIFSKIIPEAIKNLDEEIQTKLTIYHQVRKDDQQQAKTLYKKTKAKVYIDSFFVNMNEIYQDCNLIIGRGGASTIAESQIAHIPIIVVPLPTSADNHQLYNAQTVVDNDFGILLEQKNFTAKKIQEILTDLFTNYSKLQQMSDNGKKSAVINSASLFAAAVEQEIGLGDL